MLTLVAEVTISLVFESLRISLAMTTESMSYASLDSSRELALAGVICAALSCANARDAQEAIDMAGPFSLVRITAAFRIELSTLKRDAKRLQRATPEVFGHAFPLQKCQ